MKWIDNLIDMIFPPVEPEPDQQVPTAAAVMPKAEEGLNIRLYEPRCLEETKEIISYLTGDDHAAFVSLHRLKKADACRMRDMILGAAAAVNGEVRIVEQNILLCSSRSFPHNG